MNCSFPSMVEVIYQFLFDYFRWLPGVESHPTLIKAAIMLKIAGALIGGIAGMAGIFSWAERRVAGRMQSRQGPNRVGPYGLLQFLADGFKLFAKEDIIPAGADPVLFRIAPYLVMTAMFSVVVVLPFSPFIVFSNINAGMLYVLAIGSISAVGVIMAGWASNNKYSLLGGMRSAAQIVSYEIPGALALVTVLIYTGTMNLQEIVALQLGGWGIANWNIFASPFLFIAFFIFFIASVAENNRLPFDIPEAESELVSGYNTEYSAMRFGLFFLEEWANMFVISALATTFFLGGWAMPGVVFRFIESIHPVLLSVATLGVFITKSLLLVFVIMWMRWSLPRLRVDQLMSFCWKFLVPVGFACVMGTAVWVSLEGFGHPAIDLFLNKLVPAAMMFSTLR